MKVQNHHQGGNSQDSCADDDYQCWSQKSGCTGGTLQCQVEGILTQVGIPRS
jgi:hypothetical protein